VSRTRFPQPADLPLDLVPLLPGTSARRGAVRLRIGELLTSRELQVLRSIHAGETYALTAESLGLSSQTVKRHVSRIREKTRVTRSGLVLLWEYIRLDSALNLGDLQAGLPLSESSRHASRPVEAGAHRDRCD